MKKVEERTNLDLLELTLQLHSRAINLPNSKSIHEAYMEARQEIEKRLQVNNNGVLPVVSNNEVAVCSSCRGTGWWSLADEILCGKCQGCG